MSRSARIVVLVVVLVQMMVPFVLRFTPERFPVQFGWQMYSFSTPSPEFTVITTEGAEERHVGSIAAAGRADVDYTQAGALHLCETVDDALRVEVRIEGELVEEVPC